MRTVSVTLDSKVDIYAIMYGGRDILDKHIRKALQRVVFKARVIVKDARNGRKIMEFDWHDPRYAAQPTNRFREERLAESVQHYGGMELTLERTEWAHLPPEPAFTPSMDRTYHDKDYWKTPYIFSTLGLGIVRPEHKVLRTDVSA